MPLNARMVRVSQDGWRYAAMKSVFSDDFYRQLVAGLPGLTWTEATQAFYRQREVDLKDSPYYRALFDKPVRDHVSHAVGDFFDVELDAQFSIAAHKMISGDCIGVHTDENSHGESHRLTVTLNEEWTIADGGVLLTLNSSNLANIRDAWLPTANNGLLFEISERSFHAVTPIVMNRPRYSLILTFKRKGIGGSCATTWSPFPLATDIQDATSTAEYMGISANTFQASYRFIEFTSVSDLKQFIGGILHNAPVKWSYKRGNSKNVDQHGQQPKGTDLHRMEAIMQLRLIPPLLIVRRRNGEFALVDGSHRLSYATDYATRVGVAFFDEH